MIRFYQNNKMINRYRKCVGMMILNENNEVLVGKRLDYPSGYWQMPQGGIDDNEKPEDAVWREMMEEIGTNEASMIHKSSKWFYYKIPEDTLKKLTWGKIYIGQKQQWFIFKFFGNEKKININTKNPEFSEWKWLDLNSLTKNIVPFKKKLYKDVLSEFKDQLK